MEIQNQNNDILKNSEAKNNGLIPKKFLFVSYESLSGDLAWQIQKEGHEIKVYIKNQDDQDVYDGFLEKVSDWKAEKDWADVIVFDDTDFGSQADALRKEGKLVIGGSSYTDKLEMDREFGQTEMKSVGMVVLPHWDFTDFEEAIKFLKENPSRYVFKPSGEISSEQKGILFIGEEEDGKDIIEVLEHNKKSWSKKMKKFQLQKFASGVEIAAGAFFNGNDFIYPVNINFEHKKLFPGDIGPYTGEMGCYDEATEVLTKSGWKYFKELTHKDKVATLDPKIGELKYRRPSEIVVFSHHNKMVQIKNRSIDILVTPNHNMWVQKRSKKKWEFIRADSMLANAPRIARTASWQGKKYDGRKARFMGLYMAEGSVSKPKNRKGGYQVVISGTSPRKIGKIKEILDETKLPWRRAKGGWYLYDKKMYLELLKYGKSYEKFIPQEIKDADQESIRAFLDGYALGDATLMRGDWRIFYTSSKRIADDTQELLLKIGKVGIIKERHRLGRKIWIKNHYTEQKHRAFEVIERIKKIYSYLDKRDTKIIDYHGKVYCVTVPSHILYVRRNGKPYWCGNTLMYWSPANQIFNITLAKMKEKLAESKYAGYVDVNCIVNARGIYPLEFTCRFGYPTISIQMEGVLSNWGEFLYALARGENFDLKTKKGFQIGVVVAVPPFPYKDKVEFATYQDSSILFKKPNLDGIHLGDVKLVDGDWKLAGESGYALVVTGSNGTVEEARKQAYRRIKNIMLQNMYYRTDIGVKWNKDSDRLQTWGYLY